MSIKSEHFSESETLEMFLQICEGLQHIHSVEPNPLAHRDIKPHNILLNKQQQPVIMDLGNMNNCHLLTFIYAYY